MHTVSTELQSQKAINATICIRLKKSDSTKTVKHLLKLFYIVLVSDEV